MAEPVAPFFSVVIPVYNRAKDLGRALLSVLSQTCQDFEIVVVDDGSQDNPKAVVDVLNEPRIHFVRQRNRGGGVARNTGIDVARGQFIAFLDSDDVFLPHHLANMKALLEGTQNIAGYARMVVDRGNGRVITKPPRAIRPDEHMATYLLCDRGFVPTITLAVPAAMAKVLRYHESLRVAEDTDFAVRLFLAGCEFRMIETPGAIWNDHYNPHRTSAGRKGARLLPWVEQMKSRIPPRAYHGARGWAVAKGVAVESKFWALRLYLNAVLRGCYRPRLAVIIFLQIFLSNSAYRKLADTSIGWLKLSPVAKDAPAKPPASTAKPAC
ncbi:MAG TPA: glycosyltransferase family 2 protein [Rhizomicrobium sp.]|jgi:glycosyltransferase involved in cell wall biosynthesis|nr:glycosyltransferase family 2 protein [Rhizomicrobium sp.]